MAPQKFTRVVLAQRPVGHIDDKTFRKETIPYDLKPSTPDSVVVQVDWLSLDPAMRGWLNDTRSYLPPVQIGEIMRAEGLGTVIEVGSGSKFKVGDVVKGTFGWTEYAVMKDKTLTKIEAPTHVESLDFLGVLGASGMTAYFGLLDVGKIQPGETLVVSGAAGAVGSVVCQIGKIKGAKVVAIAGSAEKCRWLENDLGVDKAINYKDADFKEQFKKHVGYLDVFFDNVGGEILDFALTRLNQKARIVLCGAISDYNAPKPRGLQSYLNLISQRARIEGFIVFDYASQYATAADEMGHWIKDGKLKRKFHTVEGIASAPEALPMLFTGGNTGKLVVKVSQIQTSRL
ncbi:alcohol dehydrogenase [Rickenella mellea]|uniref:Alcohol dehydrogenase n=1 Tax=Rickenella mellea TaxID=50990 RepID=A0A4Y7QEP3_9AGAM|nr:alcohol dehydrogenase [Rickenella mellea]